MTIIYCEPNDAGREATRTELISRFNAEMIHPSQDPRVISGQGTIGIELFNQAPNLDLVVIPVGGGGLISGIATAEHKLQQNVFFVSLIMNDMIVIQCD